MLLNLNDYYGHMIFDNTRNNGLRLVIYNEIKENTKSIYPHSIQNMTNAFDFLFDETTNKKANIMNEKSHNTF